MRTGIFIATAICALFSVSAKPLYGFSQGGHKVAAIIAFTKLSVEARGKLISLLSKHPRYQPDFVDVMPEEIAGRTQSDRDRWVFAEAAIWPDKPRGFSGENNAKYHRATWHYINLPVFLSESDEAALAGQIEVNLDKEWHADLEERTLNALQALDMIKQTFAEDSTDDARRALLLCWAMHIIGDLHQPLHCATLFSEEQFPNGDRGGNSLKVRTRRLGSITNLHSLWDGLLGRDIAFNTVLRRSSEISDDESITEEVLAAADVHDAAVWIEEGAKIAGEFAYTAEVRAAIANQSAEDLEPVLLPEGYPSEAGAIARKRVGIAGHRLAAFLDTLLTTAR